MKFPSIETVLFWISLQIGYPQGEKDSPATISASIRKATKSFPCIHALAASKSDFFKWPIPMIDFNRLKTSSICHRPRYISKIDIGPNLKSSVVNTKIYPAASMVSGFTVRPFLLFSFNAFRRAFSAACLFFFKAQITN